MAAPRFRRTALRKIGDALLRAVIRLGVGGKDLHVLRVRGRRSGRVYSTPVQLIQQDGRRWLVAPYGEVGWVRNARAAGEVTLSRSGRSETLRISEASPEEAAPVLQEYVRRIALVRKYFDATPDSDLAAFAAEAHRHPVFALERTV